MKKDVYPIFKLLSLRDRVYGSMFCKTVVLVLKKHMKWRSGTLCKRRQSKQLTKSGQLTATESKMDLMVGSDAKKIHTAVHGISPMCLLLSHVLLLESYEEYY